MTSSAVSRDFWPLQDFYLSGCSVSTEEQVQSLVSSGNQIVFLGTAVSGKNWSDPSTCLQMIPWIVLRKSERRVVDA